jgi:hypothetical protein
MTRILSLALLLALACYAVMLTIVIATKPAKAHEAVSGMSYPARCCWSPQAAPAGRPGDCDEIPDHAVTAVQGGYAVTLAPGDHPMVKKPLSLIVPYDKVEHAEDGKFHICFRADMTARCFFSGASGS